MTRATAQTDSLQVIATADSDLVVQADANLCSDDHRWWQGMLFRRGPSGEIRKFPPTLEVAEAETRKALRPARAPIRARVLFN